MTNDEFEPLAAALDALVEMNVPVRELKLELSPELHEALLAALDEAIVDFEAGIYVGTWRGLVVGSICHR